MHEAFGVRRPLRFLAHQLQLSEEQVAILARVISDLKTERAQEAVDERRSLAAFADAIKDDAFDAQKAQEGSEHRKESSERVHAAVLKALGELHALLSLPQREHLALLIRRGDVTL